MMLVRGRMGAEICTRWPVTTPAIANDSAPLYSNVAGPPESPLMPPLPPTLPTPAPLPAAPVPLLPPGASSCREPSLLQARCVTRASVAARSRHRITSIILRRVGEVDERVAAVKADHSGDVGGRQPI